MQGNTLQQHSIVPVSTQPLGMKRTGLGPPGIGPSQPVYVALQANKDTFG